MRRARWLLSGWVLAGALSALGCGGDEVVNPSPIEGALSLRVRGNPAYLTGKVVIEAEASPLDAFRSVELRVGGVNVAVAEAPPFAFELDTTAYADGYALLDATGIPDAPSAPVSASLGVEMANQPPALTLASPVSGATLIGSPSKGFSVKPVVAASDGNGIAAIWAEAGGEPIDLGLGDGTVEVPLASVGVEFPHAAVPITIHARDNTGAESVAVAEVVPSNVRVRFERKTGFAMDLLNRVDVLDDGRPLLHLGSSVYLLPEPTIPAEPSLTLKNVGDFLRHGSELFYFASSTGGADFMRALLGGGSEELFGLSQQGKQLASGGPFVHASGRVIVAWQDIAAGESHLLAFEPDGTPVFDTVVPGLLLLYEAGFAPDGRILGAVTLPDGEGIIQPFDGDTGAPLPAYGPGSGQIMLADDQGVVFVFSTSTTYGAPEAHFAEIGFATGEPMWDELVGSALPQLVRRSPEGGILTFLFGAPSTLQLLGEGAAQTLWAGGLDKQDVLVGTLPGTSEMVVARFNGTTSLVSAFLLHPDGSLGWSTPLPGGPGYRAQLLSDGSLAFASAPLSLGDAPTVAFTLVGPDGQPRWSETLEALAVLGVAEVGDLVILPCNRGSMKPFSYEARDRATGKLVWRYREGASPPLFQLQTMKASAPWGVLFAPLILSEPDPVGMKNTSVVLGFVP